MRKKPFWPSSPPSLIASLTLSLPGTTLGVLAVLNVIVGCLIVALSKDDLVDEAGWPQPSAIGSPRFSCCWPTVNRDCSSSPTLAHRLDHLFIMWDQTMLHSRWVEWALYSCAPWLQHYLELCYLLCYPLVPLGFAALYLARTSITTQREPGGMPKDLSFRGVPRPRDDEESRRSLLSRARFLASLGMTRFNVAPQIVVWRKLLDRQSSSPPCSATLFIPSFR